MAIADPARRRNPVNKELKNTITSTDKDAQYDASAKRLFPRATSQVAMPAWIFGDCREGQIPRCLQRCKIDTPLLAAGYLIGT